MNVMDTREIKVAITHHSARTRQITWHEMPKNSHIVQKLSVAPLIVYS